MKRTRLIAVATTVSLAGLVVTADRAAAEPTWTDDVLVSDGPDIRSVNEARLVVDSSGVATVTWEGESYDPVADTLVTTLWAATRLPGAASYGDPVALAVETAETDYDDIRVATNDAGRTAITWVTDPTEVGTDLLMVSLREPGEVAFPPGESVSEVGERADQPEVVVAPNGAVTVVYFSNLEEGTEIVSRTLEAGATVWSEPQVVDASDPAPFEKKLVVDDTGEVSFAWATGSGLWTTWRPRLGPFHAPQQVPTSVDDFGWLGDMAVGADGTVALAYHDIVEGDEAFVVVRQPGSSFDDPLPVAPAPEPENRQGPRVAVAPDGIITMAWETSANDGVGIRVATVSPESDIELGYLDGPSETDRLGIVDLVAADDGVVTAVWRVGNDGAEAFRFSRRPAGGEFGEPQVVEGTESSPMHDFDRPQVAADAQGDVTLVWTWDFVGSGTDPVLEYVHSSVLDVTAPEVDWPATGGGTAGLAVSFAATATDTWSGPPTLAWDFGDGTSGAGASTSHAYAAAGSYPVTLTASDAAGNRTTLTRSVTISAAP